MSQGAIPRVKWTADPIALATDKTLQEERDKIGSEPLLPIEKKLIVWSLGLGMAMLVILGIVSRLG